MGRAMRNGSPRGATPTPRARGGAMPPPLTQRSSAGVPQRSLPRSIRVNTPSEDSRHWPLYEVFVRARGGLDHKHVGSLHAADARMAIDHARDLYTRRQEGVSIWVVPSKDITASDPAETDSLFEPARDKIYRHPTFYDIPEEVKTL